MRHLKTIHGFMPLSRFLGEVTACIVAVLLCTLLFESCATTPPPKSRNASSSPLPVISTDGPVDRLVKTTGCGRTPLAKPGTSVDEILPVNPAESLGRSTRTYRLHIPSSYQYNQPQALVLVFHGAGGHAADIENGTAFSPFADQHDIIVAYPQGLPNGEGGTTFWASDGPMDYGIDDVHFTSTLLSDLQNKLCIDAHRIFVTGFSNGAGMSGLLACELAGRIAAAAPVAGNFYAIPGGCQPHRSIPILEIHGSADSVLPYNGYADAAWPLPPIPQWLQQWATRDGCRSGPMVFLRTAQVTAEHWTACQQGAEVIHYRVEGGGHSWPAQLGENSSLDVIWNFFQNHPLATSSS